jgi:Lrp/AsnC family leucine-responsive transcriptional regulator
MGRVPGSEEFGVDEVDRKLLKLLQENSEIPYSVLGRKLGISSSGVHKRVKRLLERGVIERFAAIVKPQALGKKLKAFVGISTSAGSCARVIEELRRRPEVLEIHEIAGEHDLFAKIVTEDTLKLNEILHEVDTIPGVSTTRTLVVLKTEKESFSIPP